MAGASGWRRRAQRAARVAQMTVEHAQASSIEIDKTRSPLKQTAVGRDTQHSRFGIKTKLFLAFFSLAGLTVLASAIAWYVFRDIERAVTRVTVESVNAGAIIPH